MTKENGSILIENVPSPRSTCMNEFSTAKMISLANLVGANANGSCALKRKRPPRIEIPNVLREISTDILKGKEEDDGISCFSGSGFGVFAHKGKKKFMEDAHKVVSSSNEKKGFFGVYDGHGGSKAAEFVAENLHLKIFEMMEKCSDSSKAKEEAVKAGYLKTDEEFLKQGLGSGACCVTALIEGQEMVVSNLGDCRAVLCRRGVAEALTVDHRAGREDERRRIEDKGGYVEMHRGAWRVHGILSVSRSIGDAHLKDWVMAEPDTTVISLTQDMEYLILASDGLWEEVGNQEAIDIVKRQCSGEKNQPSPKEFCNTNGCISTRPLLKPLRVPLARSKKAVNPSTRKKTPFHQKGSGQDEFRSENDSPPSKARRISLAKQVKLRTPSPNDENACFIEQPAYGGILAACKELVNLALTKGTLDDITVMIIDLNSYRG